MNNTGANEDQPRLAIIVPVLNEADNLPRLVKSLRLHLPSSLSTQLIVVDNGSTDGTFELAKSLGAEVYRSGGAVASARNKGARKASSSVLAFLDADVEITESWGAEIEQTIENIVADEHILSGAWYRIRSNASFLERYWFMPLESGDHSHMNAGNLLISKSTFQQLGGFDEALTTGEDYEFSKRAISEGCHIVENSKLAVIHYGYPTSIREFFRREVWHGMGDYSSIKAFLSSKVALISQIIFALSIGAIIAACLGNNLVCISIVVFVVALVIAVSKWKYGSFGYTYVLVNAANYFVYFIARAWSIIPAVMGSTWKSRHRLSKN